MKGHSMKSALLFLIVFFCSVSTANAAYHNATTIIRKGEIPGSFLVTTTLNDIGPIPDSNICNGTITSTAYPCGYTFAIYPIASNGSVATARLITDLVDRRPPNQCSTSTCKTNIATAKTIGELVPLMKYRGGFGIAKTELIRPYFELEGFRSCLYFSNSSAVGNGSSGRFDCSPLIPLTTSCDILDTDALVNFGTFGNDVVSAAYVLFAMPQVPECRASMRVHNHDKDAAMERVLLVSIVPEGARQLTMLMSGSFFDGDTRYVVDRSVEMSYQRRGSNYTMWVTKNTRKPQDSVIREDMNRRLPIAGQQLHLRIERIDRHHYLFTDNHSPLFVCVTGA